jgi:hypothetical protein
MQKQRISFYKAKPMTSMKGLRFINMVLNLFQDLVKHLRCLKRFFSLHTSGYEQGMNEKIAERDKKELAPLFFETKIRDGRMVLMYQSLFFVNQFKMIFN